LSIEPNEVLARPAAFENRLSNVCVDWHVVVVVGRESLDCGRDVAFAPSHFVDQLASAVEDIVGTGSSLGLAGQEADGQDDEGGGLHSLGSVS
jgi:hypothetical protein